jgi:hypothetical protein
MADQRISSLKHGRSVRLLECSMIGSARGGIYSNKSNVVSFSTRAEFGIEDWLRITSASGRISRVDCVLVMTEPLPQYTP